MRNPGESPEEYKERLMDPISPSYCAAKWYMATINLGAGQSRSCHHPSEHPIPQVEVQFDHRAIHNTKHKKEQRKKMLKGERPEECSYCWRIEDMNVEGTVADRVFYTSSFDDDKVVGASEMPWDTDVVPVNLEISFDRICNFACMYCSPNYSTTWAKDIKNNGPYQNLIGAHFQTDGSAHEPYGKYNEGNPYVQAFWDWWPELRENLKILRITGGEPIMSPHFWKLTKLIEDEGVNPNMQFAVNSNLGGKFDLIEKLAAFSHRVPEFGLYASCEAHGAQAEYIRDGLDYQYWIDNMWYFMKYGNASRITVMTTINALCLWSLTDFLDDLLEMKAEFGGDYPLISINMLRHPTFMAPLVLPEHLRLDRKEHLENWYAENAGSKGVTQFDRYAIRKLIAYLGEAQREGMHGDQADEHNFYHYYQNYDARRGKDFRTTFEGPLADWYDELEKKYK